jgi:hypothetical protein
VNDLCGSAKESGEVVGVPTGAFLRFFRLMVGFAEDSRLSAVCLMTATFCGPKPVRSRARSSWKTTSSTQCSRFSMPQWPRTARAKASASDGVPFGLAADHAEHGEAGKHRLARVAAVGEQPINVVTDGVLAGLDPVMRAIDRLAALQRGVLWWIDSYQSIPEA